VTSEEFAKFQHETTHALMKLNEAANRDYQILEWPRWDYDLEQGTITFSEHGVPRVIGDVLVVGTTSDADGTWLWSWANDSLPTLVKEPMHRVREYGEAENIEQLTKDFLEDDEYLGWGMTAIAAEIMGAKGGYRCPGDNGFLYLIYLDVYHAEQAPDRKQRRRIRCDQHPLAYSTYVCEHLSTNSKQQWFSSEPTEENRWPDAWCAECNKYFEDQGEWNEKNEEALKIKLLCHECYEYGRGWRCPH
jgi:hypothetical protein